MLTLSIIFLILKISCFEVTFKFTNIIISRIISLVFIYSALLSFNVLQYESFASGINLFSGIFEVSTSQLYFECLFLCLQAFIILFWGSDKNFHKIPLESFIIILIFSIGSIILLSCCDFFSFFICLEILTFTSSILIAIYKFNIIYAATKYFILNGFNSSFILFSIVFIYYLFGLYNFKDISITLLHQSELFLLIFVPLLIGITIKLAIFPNHSISVNIYDKLPIILTNWIIIIPKLPLIFILIEFLFNFTNPSTVNLNYDSSYSVISITILSLGIINIVAGAVLGISQIRIKRLLVYSGMNHLGFILLAISNINSESLSVILFYIFQYSVNSLTIFIILLCFIYKPTNSHITFIHQLKAPVRQFIYFVFALNIFSLCGIPPIVGFFSKIIVLQVSLNSKDFIILLTVIITTIINSTYYLKILKIIYFCPISENNYTIIQISNVHGFFIILFTFFSTFFIFNADIWLNFYHILSFSIFYYLVIINNFTDLHNTQTIILFFIFIIIFSLFMLCLNFIFAIHNPDSEKNSSYECGYLIIVGQTRKPFNIQFYLIGILFLVFDIEILLIFPFAKIIVFIGSYGLFFFIVFFSVLTIGFIYELQSGSLNFTSSKRNLLLAHLPSPQIFNVPKKF